MGRRPPRCRHCDAPIDFVINEANNRRIATNVGPDDDGTMVRTGSTSWDGLSIVTAYSSAAVAQLSNVGKDRYSRHRCE